MKRHTLLLFLFAASINVFAQEQTSEKPKAKDGNNEIRVNLLNTILGSIDLQYERILKDNSGLGVTVGFGYGDDEVETFNTIFNVTPAYRVYFSKKKGSGFFVEGSTRFSYDKDYSYYSYYKNNNYYRETERNKKFNLGFGLALGGKVITKQGLVGSFKGGIGRFVTNDYPTDSAIYPNLEISIGKRF